MSVKVLSVGGSILIPDGPDPDFIGKFVEMTRNYLANHPDDQLILVIGGGSTARTYQGAFRAVTAATPVQDPDAAADWIGVKATHLNAELIKACFGELCTTPVVTDPTTISTFPGRVLIAAGWKPGFSTDNDAVLLATKFSATEVINLSNIAQVYTADPKKDPTAEPRDRFSWPEFRELVGDTWDPGANLPFDPIASKLAAERNLTVICADGHNLENTKNILERRPFVGTTIN